MSYTNECVNELNVQCLTHILKAPIQYHSEAEITPLCNSTLNFNLIGFKFKKKYRWLDSLLIQHLF